MGREGRKGGEDDLRFRGVKVVLDGRGSGDSGVLPAPRCWVEVRGVIVGSAFSARFAHSRGKQVSRESKCLAEISSEH